MGVGPAFGSYNFSPPYSVLDRGGRNFLRAASNYAWGYSVMGAYSTLYLEIQGSEGAFNGAGRADTYAGP